MKSKTTFSQQIKEEIANEKEFSKERRLALLSAYIRINGVLAFKNKETNIHLKTDNSKIAKYIYSQLKSLFPDDGIHLDFFKTSKGHTRYLIIINNKDNKVLDCLNVDFFEGKISKEIAFNDETIAGYIAGAFLASGSVNSPETSNYHLEISTNSENYAKWLAKLFGKYKKLDLEPKIISRRDKTVIYFKKSDQISNFLILIGAPEGCMDFENARVKRDFVNSNNRLINFDEANMRKASIIGRQQAREIQYIDNVLGIHNLHNQKKELLCYLRMENKEVTLMELAEMLSEEMGIVVTKSNVNHLFRSLHELYIKLKGVK